MNHLFRNALIAAAIALPAVTTLTACDFDGNDLANVLDILNGINGATHPEISCAQAQTDLQTAISEEGQLTDKIDMTSDYSMALTLNANSINKLFKAATEWNYDLDILLASIKLQLPTIAVGGCKAESSLGYAYEGDLTNCLSFEIPVEGSLIGAGKFNFSMTFGIPVVAEVDGVEKSSVYVDLQKAQILDMRAGGSSTLPIARDAIEQAVKELFKEQLTPAHLFDIAAWEMGDNQVKMLAGAPRVNEREGTLTFGMYSNLKFAQTGSVDWAYEHAFPKDAEIGLHIHPDLIRGLLARMMYEKHIENSIAGDGSSFTVTMANMAKDYDQATLLASDPEFADYFTFAFRMWSTENICGYMDVLAGLKLEIDQNHFTIGVGNVKAGQSSGGMSLFAGILGTVTSTQYFQDIMKYATYTFNFNEITVPDKNAAGGMRKTDMGSNTFSFEANGTGISLFLNFLDF